MNIDGCDSGLQAQRQCQRRAARSATDVEHNCVRGYGPKPAECPPGGIIAARGLSGKPLMKIVDFGVSQRSANARNDTS